jgi:prepilin peptidase CpaA
MGAGDVKLMAAIGAIAGPGRWFWIFVFSAVLGAVFAVLFALSRGRLVRTFRNIGLIVRELAFFRAPYSANQHLDVTRDEALRLPHGAAIALGTLGFLLWSAYSHRGFPPMP